MVTRRDFLAASALLASACRVRDDRMQPQSWRVEDRVVSLPQVLVVDLDEGPGFGAYLVELLGSAGVIGVRHVRARDLSPDALATAAAVITCGQTASVPGLVQALRTCAERGGVIVGMDPPASWLDLFGIDRAEGAAPAGVVDIAGMVDGDGLRLHVPARAWQLRGGTAVDATLRSADRAPSPAVVRRRLGRGVAYAWNFDLAKNVAYIRQGNPAWANQDRVVPHDIQMEDAMWGWLTIGRLARPDADVYLALLLQQLSASWVSGPVLNVDHFPGGAQSAFIATSDAHWASAGLIEQVLKHFEAAGARVTVYYEPPVTPNWRLHARRARWAVGQWPLVGASVLSEFAPPSPARVRAWRERGHEFAPHPVVVDGLQQGLARSWQRFADDGYGVEVATTRTHSVLWSGWVETARALREYGSRMNFDAYGTGLGLRLLDGSFAHGHLVGSGLPARFVDESGEVIDSYQQPTQLIDEQLLAVSRGPEKLSGAQAADVLGELLEQATSAWPAALAGVFHADNFVPGLGAEFDASEFVDRSLAICRQKKVPVLTAGEWLRFQDARRAVELTARTWDPSSGRLSCTLQVPDTLSAGIALLLPATCAGADLQRVDVDGTTAEATTISRGGRTWTRVMVRPGKVRLDLAYGS